MMHVKPENPVLKAAVVRAIENDSEDYFQCSDYDNCKYKIQLNQQAGGVLFSFTCYNFREIYDAGQGYFVTRWYSDYPVTSAPEQGFDITFLVPLSNFKSTHKIPKNAPPEEQERIKEANRVIKEENKILANKIGDDFSRFRRNFYASPFELMLNKIAQNVQAQNAQYSTRDSERTWLVYTEENKQKSLTVYFGVSFKDPVDKTLAKLILDEMEEARRTVKNATPVLRSQDGRLPDSLVKAFPQQQGVERFQNGLICITLFKELHIDGQVEKAATFLASLRQYLHYHIHSQKSYLHSRTIKRINKLYEALDTARFEKAHDKQFRTLREENRFVPGSTQQSVGVDSSKRNVLRSDATSNANLSRTNQNADLR